MRKQTLLIAINIITFLSILGAALFFTQVLRSQLVENFTDEEQNHEMAFAETIANTLRLEMENNVTILTQLTQLPEIQSADPAVCNQKLDDLFLKYGGKLTNIGRMNTQGIFDCSHNRAAIGVNGPSVAPHLKTIIEDPEHRPVLGRLIAPAAGAANTAFDGVVFIFQKKILPRVEQWEES